MERKKCIYCLEDLDASAFNKEHVLPRAFGNFRDNLTLPDCVCMGCNNYFGWNLEIFLTRDSIEALRRLQYGLKPVEKVADLQQDRLSFSIAEEGEWQGVRFQLRSDEGELVGEVIPQVGLARKGVQGRTYFTEPELADLGSVISEKFDLGAGINVISSSEDAAERLVALLADRGIKGEKRVPLPPPAGEEGRVLAGVSSRIDAIIRRCVAKIAFNYMAWVGGADFACNADFDVTRSFIRHGAVTSYPVVLADQTPILHPELPTWRGTRDHLITLNWSPTGYEIFGQVSIFNEITYRITLTKYFSGFWRDIQKGHRFDWSKGRVKPLTYSKLKRP